MDWLTEPFSLGFMQNALLALIVSGAACAWLGVHITLRRMSFFGDALAHSTLPGVVLAHVLGWHLLVGALASALTAVVGVAWSAKRGAASEDSTIGVMMTGLFALGIIGVQSVDSQRDLTHILLGSMLGVTTTDLQVIIGCCLGVAVVLAACHRLLVTTLIDAKHARAIGCSPDLARIVVLICAAFAVVSAITVVGLILAVALLITPAATARLMCRRISSVIIVATSLSVLCAVGGMLIAWHASTPAGATIVVLLSSTFLLTRAGSGVVRQLQSRHKKHTKTAAEQPTHA